MSAFMVTAACIDRVVMVAQSFQKFQHEKPSGLYSDSDMLGMYLIEMNRRAVQARYGKQPDVEPYCFTEQRCRPIQCYKSLRCFLYQCGEGNVPNDPVFIRLSWLERELAKIFGHRPDGSFTDPKLKADYDAAGWG